MPTYLDLILDVLVQAEQPLDVPQILEALQKPPGKSIYVIDALKRGMRKGFIEKIENPKAKNQYKHHFYKIREPQIGNGDGEDLN